MPAYEVRELNNFKDFAKVFKIFESEPYNEVWTRENILKEYDSLKELGEILGYYLNNQCIGFITFRDMIDGEHPVQYSQSRKIAYFSDVAIIDRYRKKGYATTLLHEMLKRLKKDDYDIVYMRTMVPEKSMSYNMVVRNGFKLINNVHEEKEMLRTNGELISDRRIFLEFDLNNYGCDRKNEKKSLTFNNYSINVINNFEHFKNMYKVFSYPPYYEVWKDDELLIEYNKIKKSGVIFGCYLEKECLGMITLREPLENEHPIKFSKDRKIMYISDMAVLKNLQFPKVSDVLLNYAIDYLEKNNYDIVYLRTLPGEKSREYETFKRFGFSKVEGVCQIIKRERNHIRKRNDEEHRIFMKCDL